MTAPRRFDDEEIRRIFHMATEEGDPAALPPSPRGASRGLTLSELQAVGEEAGIDPALVSRAVARLEASASPPDRVRRVVGVPVGVSHSVELEAPLGDPQWDRLVVRLRETFGARGRVEREGSLRSWANGNLQVLLEPTATGQRLRFRSVSSSLEGRLAAGVGLVGMGALGLGAVALLGGIGEAGPVFLLAMVEAIGAGFLVSGVLGAPRWRNRRMAQFRALAAEALELSREGG